MWILSELQALEKGNFDLDHPVSRYTHVVNKDVLRTAKSLQKILDKTQCNSQAFKFSLTTYYSMKFLNSALIFCIIICTLHVATTMADDETVNFKCPLVGIDLQGHDIHAFYEGVDTWQECGALCAAYEGCNYWTANPDVTGSCYLKSSNNGLTGYPGVYSGDKDCY